MPAATAPLLPFQPDWRQEVTVTRTWPSAPLPMRSGREQGLGLQWRPTESITVELLELSAARHAWIRNAVETAMWAPERDRLLVRLPFWADAIALRADTDAASDVLLLDETQDATLRRFVVGGQVCIAQSGSHEPFVATIADVDEDSITLTEDAGVDLVAGMLVAPVLAVRLDPQIPGEILTLAAGRLSLTLTTVDAITGAAALVPGSAADVQAPQIASMTMRTDIGSTVFFFRTGWQIRARAVFYDANGVIVPQPGPLTWELSPGDGFRVVVPDPDGPFCMLEQVLDSATIDQTLTVTEPVSGVSFAQGIIAF